MSIRSFMLGHDENKIFVAIYIFLSAILCTFLSLFWFIVIIGAHCGIDSLKIYYQGADRKNAVSYSLKESRIDFLFIVICLALVFLCNFGVGVAGLRLLRGMKTARTARLVKGAKTVEGTRTIRGIETIRGAKTARVAKTVEGTRTIRGIETIRGAKTARVAKTVEEAEFMEEMKFYEEKIGECILGKAIFETGQRALGILTKPPRKGVWWWKSLSLGDKISTIALVISLYFILINPLLEGSTVQEVLFTIWEEMKPTIEIQLPW